ncbi:MAG TPA: response regulator [Polyangiaceae bacterium]|nr:response regulator [Polyangiaceae bacterium]
MNRRRGEGTILLVEDNPRDEELALRALRKNQIANDVVVARDGQQAIDVLLAGGPLPVLVLLDLNLPKIDGIEVLKRIRAEPRTRLLPVVILTSSAEDRDRHESYGSGANSYVCKPIDFAQFTDAVRQLGLYWLVLNEPPPAPDAK